MESLFYAAVLGAVLVVAWFFALGSVLGSYLNVLVWRLPRRIPVGMSRSRCPRCEASIRATDNIPIVSWILLRGRCRNCHEPISPRYPLVEATVAIEFALLAWFQLVLQGWNLPWYDRHVHDFPSWMYHFPQWELVLPCGLFAVMLYVTLAAALIDFDGFGVPATITQPAVLIGLTGWVIPAIEYFVHTGDWEVWRISLQYLRAGLISAGIGGLLGILLKRQSPRLSRPSLVCQPLVVQLMLISLFTDWRFAFGVFVWSVLVHAAVGGTRGRSATSVWTLPFVVHAMALLQVLAWRELWLIPGYPGRPDWLVANLGWGVLAGTVLLWDGRRRRSQ